MMDTERELFKLGIPAKTRHNEVAPGQFEIAPMFERGNIASDHQQLLMTVFKTIAKKHGMECLFHEKPFAGVNGSGKHVNFSLGNAELGSLLVPGDTPHENAQFLVFCAAVIRAVHKYAGLLRVSVASATNDHRLGANEAPPAIISIFLGDQLADVFEQIAKGAATSSKGKGSMIIGVDTLPVLPTDPGDRNRTSPFAFTGNRFEFRAPGSGQTVAVPMIMLNTIMADSLDYMATVLEKAVEDGEDFDKAVQKLLTDIITEHGAVVFNGDGYSENWQIEAAERGLPNLKTTLDALPELIKPESIELFEKYCVFNERELHSRYEVRLEMYALTIGVEAKLALELGSTVILPAAVRYQTELAQNVAALKKAGLTPDMTLLEAVSTPISELTAALAALKAGAGRTRRRLRRRGSRPRAEPVAEDGSGACRRRHAGRHCGRRSLAAADLPGDALHPVDVVECGGHARATRALVTRSPHTRRSSYGRATQAASSVCEAMAASTNWTPMRPSAPVGMDSSRPALPRNMSARSL